MASRSIPARTSGGQAVNADFLIGAIPAMLEGLKITVLATLAAAVVAFVVGLLVASIQVLKIPVLNPVITAIVLVIRNTPLLAQLFFLFYVLPRFGVSFPPFLIGVIALGLHFSCYAAEAFRGGFLAVPRGQWEAAKVLGLPMLTTLGRVILPQAIPPVIPALANLFISMFKDSAILSAITVLELLGTTRNLAAQSFQYTTLFTAMGLTYLAISLPASFAVRLLERRHTRREVRT